MPDIDLSEVCPSPGSLISVDGPVRKHGYGSGHSRTLIFHHVLPEAWHKITRATSEKKGTLYMGAEVEVDLPPDTRDVNWNSRELHAKLLSYGFMPFFLPTSDATVREGCEFVSYPANLEAWMALHERLTVPGFKALVASGLRGHQTRSAGLHVHVSRSFFGKSGSPLAVQAYSNLIVLVENNWNQWTTFARRPSNEYAMPILARSVSKERIESLGKKGEAFDPNVGRRFAVNFSNSNTIEFRFFKGTLNPTTFLATLQALSNLCNLAKLLEPGLSTEITFQDIVNFKKYPELQTYVSTLKLEVNKEQPYVNRGVEN